MNEVGRFKFLYAFRRRVGTGVMKLWLQEVFKITVTSMHTPMQVCAQLPCTISIVMLGMLSQTSSQRIRRWSSMFGKHLTCMWITMTSDVIISNQKRGAEDTCYYPSRTLLSCSSWDGFRFKALVASLDRLQKCWPWSGTWESFGYDHLCYAKCNCRRHCGFIIL